MATLDGTSSPFLASIFTSHNYLSTTAIPYLPFSIFGVIHATRIACAYRGGARAGGFDDRIGNFQAMLVPCILIFGGTTITGMMLGIIPGWVMSPIPVANYALVPLLVSKTPLLSILLSLPTLPRELLFSTIDGFTRTIGITTMGVDTVLSHPNAALRSSPWAMVVIATIAGGGGGMILPAIKGFHADWGFNSTPGWVKDGPGIDVWGATVIGYVYATLIDAHPFFRQLPYAIIKSVPFADLFVKLPKSYLTASGQNPLLPAHEAKMYVPLPLPLLPISSQSQPYISLSLWHWYYSACSLLLGLMLSSKVLIPYIRATLLAPKKQKKVHPTTGGKTIAGANAPKKSTGVTSVKEKKNQ